MTPDVAGHYVCPDTLRLWRLPEAGAPADREDRGVRVQAAVRAELPAAMRPLLGD